MLKRNAPSRQGRGRPQMRPSSTSSSHNDECTSTANSKRPRTAAATTSTAVVKRGPSRPTGLPRQRKASPMEARADICCIGGHSLSACTIRIHDRKTNTSNQGGVETRSVGTKPPTKDLAQLSQSEQKRGEDDGRLEGSRKIRSSMQLKLRSSGADKRSLEASGIASRTSTANQGASKVKNAESKRVTGWVSGSAENGIDHESQERRSNNTPINDVPSATMPPSEVAGSAARREKESTEDKASRVDTNYAPAILTEVSTKDQPRLPSATPILGLVTPVSSTALVSASTSPPLEQTVTPSASSTKARASPDNADPPSGEELENLPPSPFPGRENVSWACLACDGARHHLTSRSAMEPLRRVHGFKVHRVPNDGDCFFSSVKAALDGSPGLPREGDGEELTVARMREWVADETGKEQLDFYILQAKANPQDRWLDFVRPMDERVPSDDEDHGDGGEDEGDEDESNGVEDESSSQYTPPPARPKPSKRRGKEREAAVDGESSRDEAKRKASEATESRTEESGAPDPKGQVNGFVERNKGLERGGVVGWESLKAANEKPSAPEVEKIPTAGPETSRETCPTEIPQAPVGGRRRVGVRRSTRFGRSGVTPSRGDQAGGSEARLRGGRENDAPGLPFVRSVEELRRFVRLEGSVVGQGGCMWADTFAHHVVSRRLGITILFVDMERDKRAWPYRILAKCTDKEGSEDEQFVLLKREPNHFVLIKMDPPGSGGGPQDGESASVARNCPSFPKGGLSCFRRSELPDVVQKLWGIHPAPSAATLPVV